ncbi:MAG: addiction module protein [Candidatus Thioglobus sp.]|nr:addiction module protein [Candidatus Thioglobus sp.]
MLAELKTLPINAKIQLVEDLWDSIGQEQLGSLTQAQKKELDARLDAYIVDGNKGREINTVLNNIKNRL